MVDNLTADGVSMCVKVLQLNIWQGRLYRNIQTFIRELQPDIICLQEVTHMENMETSIPGWEMFQTLREVKRASGLKHVFFSPVTNFLFMDTVVDFGNAILSRYPLSHTSTIAIGRQPIHKATAQTYDWDARNAQLATVILDKQQVTIVNHHAHWEKDPLGSNLSTDRLQFLANILQSLPGPILVCGDFNLSPVSNAIKLFEKRLSLRNLTREANVSTTLSLAGVPVKIACDYIFSSKNIHIQNFQVHDVVVSDHLPLSIEFRLVNLGN